MFLYSADQTFSLKTPSRTFIVNNTEAGRHILQNNIFEKSLIDWSKQFCKKNKNFIDVGSHMGTYAITMAPLCEKVFAFEAQRLTYYQLCGGIVLNDFINIEAHHCALGDKNGEITLDIISEDGGGSSIYNYEKKPVLKSEKVQIKTLDSFDINNVGFIKIDVEGAELDVLKGAVETLKRSNYPTILFECWNKKWYQQQKKDLFDFFKSLNYNISTIMGHSEMFLATQ